MNRLRYRGKPEGGIVRVEGNGHTTCIWGFAREIGGVRVPLYAASSLGFCEPERLPPRAAARGAALRAGSACMLLSAKALDHCMGLGAALAVFEPSSGVSKEQKGTAALGGPMRT